MQILYRIAILACFAATVLPHCGCREKQDDKTLKKNQPVETDNPLFFDLSLAQWSLHEAYQSKKLDPMDFAKHAKSMGIEAVEYVSDLYSEYYANAAQPEQAVADLAMRLKEKSKEAGVKNLLIMVDGQGDLAVQDQTDRTDAVQKHKKWIDAAHTMGCHSIRVNLFGDGGADDMHVASVQSLTALGQYAKAKNINVLVENHGGISSDPAWLTNVMDSVGMVNVGILPDFGNFCIEREGGARWEAPCINMYPDKVAGVQAMMPYAKAMSAKSYVFNEDGEQDEVDYYAMIKMLRNEGYSGYIGIEYEGGGDEQKGIQMTKDLLIKVAKSL